MCVIKITLNLASCYLSLFGYSIKFERLDQVIESVVQSAP